MRRFRKRADLAQVFLPGRGRLRASDILVGPEYERFHPDMLELIPDEPPPEPAPAPSVTVKAPPKVESKPAPEVASKVESSGDLEARSAAAARAPDGTWSRKDLGDYAARLGIKTTGMTKVDIIRAIREKTKS